MNGNGGSDKSYPLEPQDMSWKEKTEGEYERRYRDILRPEIAEKPKPIRIQVSGEGIEAGVRNIVSNSPVTIAIKRASRIPGDVIPMWTIVRIGPTWYQISQTAQRAVQQFDSGKKIKPFSFNLVPLPDIDFLANPGSARLHEAANHRWLCSRCTARPYQEDESTEEEVGVECSRYAEIRASRRTQGKGEVGSVGDHCESDGGNHPWPNEHPLS